MVVYHGRLASFSQILDDPVPSSSSATRVARPIDNKKDEQEQEPVRQVKLLKSLDVSSAPAITWLPFLKHK